MGNDKIYHGKIVKGIAGFYYVDTQEYQELECHAKGIFRKEQKKPLVGDDVCVELLDAEKKLGSIVSIDERKNQLIRPEVANVDQALILFAHVSPQPNLNLLDKFLIMMQMQSVDCILCFNKQDKIDEAKIAEITRIYENCGCRVLSVSVQQKEGLKEIEELITGKTTALAGPSGVGKSTMLNHFCKENRMETGEISRKLERGKHTTRHSQLFYVKKDTYLMDTPGFTALSLTENLEKEEIKHFYPEFYPYEGQCKFAECHHVHEPQCAVQEAVQEGKISKIRYDGYCAIYEEIKNRKRY